MLQLSSATNRLLSKTVPLILALMALNSFLGYPVRANPINAADLSLGLSMGGSMAQQAKVNQREQQMSKHMAQIMSDQYEDDFNLSILLMNQFSDALEAFIRAEHLEGVVNQGPDVMSKWSAANNCKSDNAPTKELDLVVATFWSQFKPLVAKIIGERPPNLGPDDLDFRCTKRVADLSNLKAYSAKSSLYSIYLDTFLSEFYVHCLFRKLALVKNKNIVPTPLVRQFVDIYLNLPTMDPSKANSKEMKELAMDQLLAGRALSFKPEEALHKVGPLSAAARLVVDPRTFLSLMPETTQVDLLVQEFERDCKQHIQHLGSIWNDAFDELVRGLSTQTVNLIELNSKIKFVAPQLVYGAVCAQLVQLPH